ncbi:MAG TPA: VOC family protein [Alphaproteobacteria bacterium]|nr:VOC family protein [Alphaproteobacteria bacterium]
MPRGVVDYEGMKTPEAETIRNTKPGKDIPFNINKIGHVVLRVSNLKRSVNFYTKVLGFRISDVYPDTMVPGGMVFMRCNNDHHGVALVGGAKSPVPNEELHHMAFEVSSLDEVFRAREFLKKHKVPIGFDGRRRAGCQVAVEFSDPDNHQLEIFWGLDQVGSDQAIRPPQEWREEFSLEAAVKNAPPGQDTTLYDKSLLKKTAKAKPAAKAKKAPAKAAASKAKPKAKSKKAR